MEQKNATVDVIFKQLNELDEEGRLKRISEILTHQGIILNIILKHVPLAKLEILETLSNQSQE